jgi:hypothetical protein
MGPHLPSPVGRGSGPNVTANGTKVKTEEYWAMRLDLLKRKLRAGWHPEDISGVHLGSGLFRDAWKVGAYVVKKRAGSRPRPRSGVSKRLGLLFAEQWHVRGWVIQRYYRPITGAQYQASPYRELWDETNFDVHRGNMGFDRRGRLTMFDW